MVFREIITVYSDNHMKPTVFHMLTVNNSYLKYNNFAAFFIISSNSIKQLILVMEKPCFLWGREWMFKHYTGSFSASNWFNLFKENKYRNRRKMY
jgi:hypothetical protein